MPRLDQLAPELRRVVQRHFPDWTDSGESDPGVTLLELFAFVAEELLHRANQIPERSQPYLVTLISQLSRLLVFRDDFAVSIDGQPWRPAPDFTHAGPQDPVYVLDRQAGLITFGDGKSGRRPPNGSSVTARYRSGAAGDGIAVMATWPLEERRFAVALHEKGEIEMRVGPQVDRACPGFKRVRYFSGQLLSADDLMAEQAYFRGKQKTHNRLLHGYGVASGLDTEVAAGVVKVSAGLALDPHGNEIAVPCPVELKIPRGGRSVFLSLEYRETETDPVPAGDAMQATRIEEGFRFAFEPAPSPGAVPVAKLIHRSGRWRIDKRFRVPRTRAHHRGRQG